MGFLMTTLLQAFMMMVIIANILQVEGITCFACNPTLNYLPYKDGSVSLDDILDSELSTFTKGKGLCQDVMPGDKEKKDPKYTTECTQGCASGTVTGSLKYQMNVVIGQFNAETTTKRTIQIVDGDFKGCFEAADMPMGECGDHEKKNKTGSDNMSKGASIRVAVWRESGIIKACGCGGEFCNGGGTPMLLSGKVGSENSGVKKIDGVVGGLLGILLTFFSLILSL